MNWDLFAAFLLITTVLVITPGPIVTLVIATGASQGIRAGLVTVAGTSLGNAVLLAGIGFGLTWILANAGMVFEALRWIGAGYLVWLGVQVWRHAGRADLPPPGQGVNFSRGVLVAVTNPKTIAFFTAFLPQFVDPTLPAGPQLAAMCTVSVALAMLTDTAWAVAAGLGRAWFIQPMQAKVLGRMSGVMLIGGGVWLSLVKRPPS